MKKLSGLGMPSMGKGAVKPTPIPGGTPRTMLGKPHIRMRKLATIPKTAFPNTSPTAFDPASGPPAPSGGVGAGPAMDPGPGAMGE